MEIKEYHIKDLMDFVDSEEFLLLKTIPITRQRAFSQVNNPRADENDLALLVAYENNEVISYVGAVPDYLFINDEEIKFAWGSTGWVNPEYKSTGIYVVLLLKAMEFYHNNFGLAEVSESARKVFESSKNFIQLKNLKSKTVVCRSCSEQILTQRNRYFKIIFPFLRMFDYSINGILYPFFHQKIKSSGISDIIKSETISAFDEQDIDFIRRHSEKNLFKREKNELEWILRYPWVKESKIKPEQDKKYFFSSSAEIFKINAYRLFTDNQLTAILIIKQRDNHLSVPYAFYNTGFENDLLQYLFFYLFNNKAAKITVFNDDLISELNKVKTIKLHVKHRERKSYLTRKFKTFDFENHTIQSGDGDTVFT